MTSSPACSTTPRRYRAAIIGLGQIGNRFDDDPKRTIVWTHAGAYAAVPEVELVAGADPDQSQLQRFLERRGVTNGYHDYRTMLQSEAIDLLSVCSPTDLHYDMVLAGVRAGVKAIFCEKPLATTVEQGAEMVQTCASAGVILAVNHTRRWESIYVHAKSLVEQGFLGRLESLIGYYPGKVFTMGTHLFDLMRLFGGEVEWVCGMEVGDQQPDPTLSGHLQFGSGAQGAVVAGWNRENHLFELDLLGSHGRIRLSADGGQLDLFRFQDSPRYSGYRELVASPFEDAGCVQQENRLIAAVKDLVRCAETGGTPACTGHDGLAALEIASALRESARRGSLPIMLRYGLMKETADKETP
jgi:predicted dehydrogenase